MGAEFRGLSLSSVDCWGEDRGGNLLAISCWRSTLFILILQAIFLGSFSYFWGFSPYFLPGTAPIFQGSTLLLRVCPSFLGPSPFSLRLCTCLGVWTSGLVLWLCLRSSDLTRRSGVWFLVLASALESSGWWLCPEAMLECFL